jgi:hypothetical protein
VDLYPVGQSLEGRELWQLTIANKKGLTHTDRPAFFIEGGRHAGEISGIEQIAGGSCPIIRTPSASSFDGRQHIPGKLVEMPAEV